MRAKKSWDEMLTIGFVLALADTDTGQSIGSRRRGDLPKKEKRVESGEAKKNPWACYRGLRMVQSEQNATAATTR
jgi:hypothetical protein